MNLSNPSPPTRTILIALLALTSVVYCNSLRNEFTIDDEFVYSENHWVRYLSNLPDLLDHSYFQHSNEASYRPVATLSYFLDSTLWGDWPGGPHVTNLVLYVGTVWLLFFFFRTVTGSVWSAVAGAGLFAIHPIHTEVVNNISFREDLLIGLLLPTSWLFYKRSQRGNLRLWMPLAWLCYLIGLLSKEMAVVFPLLVVLLEYTELDGDWRAWLAPDRLRFFAGLLVCTAVFLYVRFYGMRFEGESNIPRLGGSIGATLLATTKIYGFYLFLFFCPYQMRALYPTAMYRPELDAGFLVALAALLLVVAFLIYFRRERLFVLGMLWWFVCLLPVSNLYPIFNPMAERYLYLPSIGLCLWVGWLIGSAYEAGRRAFLIASTAVLALFLCTLTFLRNPVWHDNLTLWSVTREDDPGNARILANLAAAYYNAGDYTKAIVTARRALKEMHSSPEPISPAPLHLCVGTSFFMRGDLNEALAALRQAQPFLPARFDVDFAVERTLGLIYDAKRRLSTALVHYRRAAEIDPFQADLWRKISFCELRLGRRDAAKEDWEHARRLDRNVPRFNEIETLYYKSKQQPPS